MKKRTKTDIYNDIFQLEDERFLLKMKDRWTDEDYWTDTKLLNMITDLKKELKNYD